VVGAARLKQQLLSLCWVQAPKRHSELRETLMLAIPTFFDLTATILMNIGLLWVTASVYQMMRGAEMLFAAIFSVTFLRRQLNHFHLLGIVSCLVRLKGIMHPASLLFSSSSLGIMPSQLIP
jgi:drug/metabolite transporter (DMT)-like permease